MFISKTKLENALLIILNILNSLLYLGTVSAAILNCTSSGGFQIIVYIYTCVICSVLLLNELKSLAIAQEYFRFLSEFRGQGFVFIFIGCAVSNSHPFSFTVSLLNVCTGLAYIILSYTPHTLMVNSLRLNLQNWSDFSSEGLDLPRPVYTAEESAAAVILRDSRRVTPASVGLKKNNSSAILNGGGRKTTSANARAMTPIGPRVMSPLGTRTMSPKISNTRRFDPTEFEAAVMEGFRNASYTMNRSIQEEYVVPSHLQR
ncbi:uncharacterized protein VTP21DRAFT_6850 [Calcarisporiella thermophila]|uniref:uncharacterized protein n=1 Tax=Calcarisporiella thermophila TaxID=911321 RepID=UPI0037423EEC